MSFESKLRFGSIGEGKIAQWILARGSSILPVPGGGNGKGPRVTTPTGELIAPDLLAFSRDKFTWIEAKHKSRFTWHRATSTWQTGVDRNCFRDYLSIRGAYGFPLWLLFLHEDPAPDVRDIEAGCPTFCPIGLFGRDIEALARDVDHVHSNWGRHGMVYWREAAFIRLATVEEVNAVARKPNKAERGGASVEEVG